MYFTMVRLEDSHLRERVTEYLQQFVNEERQLRLKEVLKNRTRQGRKRQELLQV